MTDVIEVPPVAPPLSEQVQSEAARMVRETQKAVIAHLAHMQRLRDDIRVMEEVLPRKRAELEHAESEQVKFTDLLREVFDFYRAETSR